MSLDFLDRLRQGSYLSPETTTEQFFHTDTLTKSGGKKIATMEILDNNESVSQDRGNATDRFPVSMYFIGDDFDKQLTDFEKLLKEHHTQDSPGYLRHPLWGDINVFPVSWQSTIELKSGAGIGKMQVEFIEVFPKKYPESALDSIDMASADLDDMSAIDFAANLVTATVATAKNIKDKIEAVVDTITTVTEAIETVEDAMTEIQSDIEGLVDDIGGNITELLFATQRLMRLPGNIIDSTMNKINTYRDMVSDIIDSITGDTGTGGEVTTVEVNKDNKKNNAVLLEAFAGFAVGCLAEAAAYTEFNSRVDTIEAIEIISDTIDVFNTAMENIRPDEDDIKYEYSGDFNFQSLLANVTARINDLLLNKSFDLKAEKKITLTTKDDIMNLCYKYYNDIDIDTINYFCNTNKIGFDEFFELPVGREITIYV